MERILVVVAAGLLLSIALAHGAWAFGVKDVVAMSRDGVPDSLIIEKIRHSDATFHLEAKDFHALKEAGVSNDVIMAMLRTEDGGYARVCPDGCYWPYHSPWYLGLDFGFYAPYYRPYAPVYVGRGFGYRGFGRPGYGYRRR